MLYVVFENFSRAEFDAVSLFLINIYFCYMFIDLIVKTTKKAPAIRREPFSYYKLGGEDLTNVGS